MADADAASCVTVAPSVRQLRARLAACGGVAKTSKLFLQEQIKTRIKLGREYPVSAVGHEFRSNAKPYKLRWTKPKDSSKSDVAYLQELAEMMIEYDDASGALAAPLAENVARSLPQISASYTSAKGRVLRQEVEEKFAAAAAPKDDDLALALLEEYKGKLLFVNDGPSWPSQTFRVFDVQFYKASGPYHDCWEATCEPVEPDGKGGWKVPSSCLVPGENVVLNEKLYGIMLASLEDPKNPKREPFVDEYASLHEQRCL